MLKCKTRVKDNSSNKWEPTSYPEKKIYGRTKKKKSKLETTTYLRIIMMISKSQGRRSLRLNQLDSSNINDLTKRSFVKNLCSKKSTKTPLNLGE